MTIITRTNGQPFATEASARQQLTTKGLQDTHEVVPHEGGYALAAKMKHDEPITLRAGDYVRIKDIGSAGQAKAIADAFIEAGALPGAGYPYEKNKDGWDNLFWDDFDNMTNRGTGGLRRLMPHQVLDATNAGTTTPKPEQPTIATTQLDTIADPITTLKQARQARDEAEQAYQEALGEAREYLGEGFELIEVGTDGPQVGGEDMTDPANWREGDVVECINDELKYCHVGGLYIVNRGAEHQRLSIKADDDGDPGIPPLSSFRFHHRPK